MNNILVFGLISCFLLAANAVIEIEELPYSYEPNVAYKYKYDAQIVSKTSINQEHLIGFRLTADVIFFTTPSQPENSFTVKFNNTELWRLHNVVQELPQYLIPLEEFEELREDEVKEEIRKWLPLPIMVETDRWNGTIRSVRTHPNDPFWSVNFKKALLNLINMHHPQTRNDFMMDKVYREATINGKCNVLYKVLPHTKGDMFLNIVKTPLLESCVEPADQMMWWKSLPSMQKCGSLFNKTVTERTESYDYVISYHGAASRNFVHTASSQAFYTMPIPTLQDVHEQQLTASLQKLEFVEEIKSLKSSDLVGVDELIIAPEVLRLVTPLEGMRNNSDLVKAAVGETRVLVKQLIDNLNNTEYRQTQLMQDTQKLLTLTRVLGDKHIKDLLYLKEFFPYSTEDVEDVNTYRRFIMDILPSISSNDSISVFVDIMKKVVGISTPLPEDADVLALFRYDTKVSQMFKLLNFIGKIDTQSYEKLMNLIISPEFKLYYLGSNYPSDVIVNVQKIDVYKSAWMSLGTLTYTTVIKKNMNWTDDEETKKLMMLDDKLTTVIKEMLEDESDQIKCIAVLTVCNSRSFRNFEDMKKLFQTTENAGLKVEILHALRKMIPMVVSQRTCSRLTDILSSLGVRKPSPRVEKELLLKSSLLAHCNVEVVEEIRNKILSFIGGVIVSHNEDTEVRMIAYKMFVTANPKDANVVMVVHAIVRKPNYHLLSYVYNHMRQMMRNKMLCYRPLVQTIKKVLSFIPPVKERSQSFNMHHLPLWSETTKLGGLISKDIFYSENEIIPKSLYLGWEAEYRGKHTPVLETGIRVTGSQTWLSYVKKLVEVYSKVYKFSKLPIDHKMLSVLEKTFSKAQLDATEDEDTEEPSIAIKIALWGSHIGHWRITPEMLLQLSESSSIDSLIPRDIKHTATFDQYMTYPTTTGFLVNYGFLHAYYATLTTSLTPEVMISPAFDQYATLTSCIDNHILKTCAIMEGELHVHPKPFELVELDFSSTKTLTWNIPEMNYNVLNYSMVITTMMSEQLYKGGSKVKESIEKKPLMPKLITEPQEENKEVDIDELGITIGVNYTYLSHVKPIRKQSLTQMLLTVSNVSICVGPINDNVKGTDRSVVYERKPIIMDPEARMVIERQVAIKDETTKKNISWAQWKMTWNDTMLDAVEINVTRRDDTLFKTLDISSVVDYYWRDESKTLFDSLDDVFNVDSDSFLSINTTITVNDEMETEKTLDIKFSSDTIDSDLMDEYNNTIEFAKAVKVCMMEANESSSVEDKFFTPGCMKLFNEVNQLKSKSLLVTMTPNSNKVRNALLYFHSMMERILYKSWDRHTVENKNEIYARFNWTTLPFTSNIWNLTMETPVFTDYFSYITELPLMYRQMKDTIVKKRDWCEIRRNHVLTLDRMRFAINDTFEKIITKNMCPVVLASDCSEDRTFNVTLHQSRTEKVLKIKLIDHLLEIKTPLLDKTTKFEIKMNNEILREHEDGEVVVPLVYNETLYINRTWDNLYYIKMITDNSTGESVTVVVGEIGMRTILVNADVYYNGDMCGLCGNFDSNANDDLTGPSQPLPYNETATLLVQNVVPINQQCKLEQDGLYEKQTTCMVNTGDDRVVLRSFQGRSIDVLSKEHMRKLQTYSCKQLLFSGKRVSAFLRHQDIILSYVHPSKGKLEIRISKSIDDVLELKQQHPEFQQFIRIAKKDVVIVEIPQERFKLIRTANKVKIQVSLDDLEIAKGFCNKINSESVLSSISEFHGCDQYFNTLRSCEIKKNTLRQITRENKPADSIVNFSNDEIESVLRSSQAPLVLYHHETPFPLQVILRLGDKRQILTILENGKVKYAITKYEEKTKLPEIVEVEKSLKVSRVENSDAIILKSSSGVQIIATRDQLYITELKETAGEYDSDGLCVQELPEFAKSLPVNVLQRVMQEQSADNFGKLDDSSKAQIRSLLKMLKLNLKSNPSGCILLSHANEELVSYEPFPADQSSALITSKMFQKLKKNKSLRCPIKLLQSSKYAVHYSKQLLQSELKIKLLRKNVELRIVQQTDSNLENVETKMFVNDREDNDYEDEDVRARIQNSKKFDFTSNQVRVSMQRDDTRAEVVAVNVFTDFQSLEGVCVSEKSPSENFKEYLENASTPAGRQCLRELAE